MIMQGFDSLLKEQKAKGNGMSLVVSWIAEVEDWGQPRQGIVNGYDGI